MAMTTPAPDQERLREAVDRAANADGMGIITTELLERYRPAA